MRQRILVVDDDASLAEMLTIVLRGEGFDTAVIGDGTQALTAVRELRPDLVLLDLMLPGMNGIDVCRVLRADSGVPIVMLTAKTDTVDVVLGLESGADDYIMKPFKPKELVARVRARLRRNDDEPAEMLSIADVEIDVPAHKVTRNGEQIFLTPLEFDLLVALARKPRQVFTRDVLLEQVWGYRHPADTRLVNVHVQRLRAKVEKDPENPTVVSDRSRSGIQGRTSVIWGSRRRTRSRWGRSGPMTRGMGALSRAVGIAWRRSLQLRVVALTLGLSLAVILALGFVLTSQVTNRVLDVKVKAAIEQIERARTTVSGIVNGEETRSLDSSLQLARNTLTSKTDPASGAGLAGAFDAVLMVPGDGPRAASAAGPVDQVPNSLRGFVKAGQAAYQYATVHTEGFSGPALIIGTPTSSQVANLELYLIFPLKNEQATITLVRGTMVTGGAGAAGAARRHRAAGLPPGGGAGAVGVADRRTVRRGASVRTDAGARRGRHGAAGGVVQRHGREPVPADHPARGVRQPAAPVHLRRQPRTSHAADHRADGRRLDLRPQRRPRPRAARGPPS